MDKEDVVHIDIGILLSHKKKNEIIPFAGTWMDLEIVILSEVSQTQKDKYMIPLICGIQETGYKQTYLQNRSRVTNVENKLMVTRGWGWEG